MSPQDFLDDLTYVVNRHNATPYGQSTLRILSIVNGIVMKQTVKSLTAMLIINRFRAVLACEFRTTTQQTLKLVNIPTTIKILKKKLDRISI